MEYLYDYIRHICHIFDVLIWKMYMHVCAKYEVTAINHAISSTVHKFYIYYRTDMAAIVHIYFHFMTTAAFI